MSKPPLKRRRDSPRAGCGDRRRRHRRRVRVGLHRLRGSDNAVGALPHGVLPIGPDRDTADILAKALAKRGKDIHAAARVGAVRAAAGAPAGKLALRAPAIQVTACSFNRELGRPPGQDATTFRWGCLHGLTRFHDLLGEQRR